MCGVYGFRKEEKKRGNIKGRMRPDRQWNLQRREEQGNVR